MREEAEAEAEALLDDAACGRFWTLVAHPVLTGLLLARDRRGLQNRHVREWARAHDVGLALEAAADDPELRPYIDATLQEPPELLSGMWGIINIAVRRLPGA